MKKTILMAFVALISAQATFANANTCAQEGFNAGGFIGNQYQSSILASNDNAFNGAKASLDIDLTGTNAVEDFGEPATDSTATTAAPLMVAVNGSALDYDSANTFLGQFGLVAGLSLGYKTLFACGQYSAGLQLTGAYEGSSSKSNIFDSTSEVIITTTGENAADQTFSSVDTADALAGNISLRGGMTWGVNFLLGKEFNWGNVSALVGMKMKQFTLNYLTADSRIVNQDTAANYKTLFPGWESASEEGDNALNTYSSINAKKYSTALSLGFVTSYYISDSVALGMSFVYDLYAPVSFKLDNVAIASAVTADGEGQLTDSGTMKFQNNCFTAMVGLTYSFGASN